MRFIITGSFGPDHKNGKWLVCRAVETTVFEPGDIVSEHTTEAQAIEAMHALELKDDDD